MRSCADGGRSTGALCLALRLLTPALPLGQRAILANEQLEVLPLFVGELEKDALAFRFLEPLAVASEEAMRRALAADADHQRLLVVDALRELLGARGEQAVGRAFEEEERRIR